MKLVKGLLFTAILSSIWWSIFGNISRAQSFNTGIPLPGLPKSVGQKPAAQSTSVTLATDQQPITVTGNITTNNASVGTNNATAPTSSTLVAFKDPNGLLIPFPGTSTGGITVTSMQGTTPWSVSQSGTWTVQPGNTPNTTPWLSTINQGGNSANVTSSNALKVDNSNVTQTVTGSVIATQGTSPWLTSRNWLLSNSTDSVGVTGTVTSVQGTTPWVVTGTVTSNAVTVTASTISRLSNSASNQTLLNANGARKTIYLYNDSTTNCYIKLGVTASLTSFSIKLFTTSAFIMDPPIYTGQIDYICDSGTGSMEVTEQ